MIIMAKHFDGISEQQYKCIQLLVYSDMSVDEIAKEVGVNRATTWRWRTKDEQFKDELAKERKNKFHVFGDVAQKELMNLVQDRSDKRTQLQAIKMLMSELGYCNDKTQMDLKTTVEFIIGDEV